MRGAWRLLEWSLLVQNNFVCAKIAVRWQEIIKQVCSDHTHSVAGKHRNCCNLKEKYSRTNLDTRFFIVLNETRKLCQTWSFQAHTWRKRKVYISRGIMTCKFSWRHVRFHRREFGRRWGGGGRRGAFARHRLFLDARKESETSKRQSSLDATQREWPKH